MADLIGNWWDLCEPCEGFGYTVEVVGLLTYGGVYEIQHGCKTCHGAGIVPAELDADMQRAITNAWDCVGE